VTGTLPYFTWVDAQISLPPAENKELLARRRLECRYSYNRTGFGSPYVGGVYYISYGYNLF
jgi:hypothetical protein